MVRTHRLSTIGALILCLVGTQWSSTLFASGQEPLSGSARTPGLPRPIVEPSRFTLSDEILAASATVETRSNSFDQRDRDRRGRGGRGRNDGAAAAIVLGAAAAIAGGAVLVYANRPECSTNQFAGGCGYGTKVVGGAVLSAGIVGLAVGALTWR
jgi:hypothetical protein